ncbi:MAG: phosphoglucosamine mutase [Nitriliruptorales bacterium]|nr:phosphoglucosamine mutase [Nitriliruptorales bacterium]
MGSIFGTDGVRGEANVDLTPELATAIGRALVTVLVEEGERRPSILIGRDPRWSGEMLESALIAGLTSAGGDAVSVDVMPTPGVAHLTATGSAAAGVMISASHNPVEDNGIKIFGPDGFKLTDAEEARLEELIEGNEGRRVTGTDVGRRLRDAAAVSRYVQHLVSITDVDLTGLRVVVDGANGAASQVAPQVYRHLGAEVITINCSPDGSNINEEAGSTYPEVICQAVIDHSADAGISHDGDADRLIAATHQGAEVDGDAILAILAQRMHVLGSLNGDTVVTTVMTNLGFKKAMDRLGVKVVETQVGDRYVLEAMRAGGFNLGGEQSGHVILLDHATTGDGVLTAVRLLTAVRRTGESLEELSRVMRRLPQVLINVSGVDKSRLDDADGVRSVIEAEEARLGDGGRVLVRPSGTEPLVRVMVEAETSQDAEASAQRIADAVTAELVIA